MASHYKAFLSFSESDEFCFMPTVNTSTLGIINQTVIHPQTEPPARALGLPFQFVIVLFGITANSLIAFVLLKNKILRTETIASAIFSLVGANLIFCIVGVVYSLSPDTQLRCKTLGMMGLDLCFARLSTFWVLGFRGSESSISRERSMKEGFTVHVFLSQDLPGFHRLLSFCQLH